MTGKNHIWIINQYAGSVEHGMEYRHYYLAKEFIKKGFGVSIISGSYSHLYSKKPEIKSQFTFQDIEGIKYCWVKLPRYSKTTGLGRIFNMFVFMLKLFFLPASGLNKPSAIIVSSPSLFPVINGKIFSRKYKAKLVFEVRDIWPLTIQELGNISAWHPVMLILKAFERYAYKKADFVCSVLPGAKQHMVDNGLNEAKFFCIPNGIDVDEVSNPEALKEDIIKLIPDNKFIVGYIGTIGISNALDYLIDAAKLGSANESIHIIIVGEGGEKERLMKKAGNLKNITFIPSINKKQVQSMLACFDVCYIGWKKENLYRFGISANKIFDYLFSAKPIIHSVEAFNDPVKESGSGISVRPESSEEIHRAILDLFNKTGEEKKEMGLKGRSFVIKNHAYSNICQQLIDSIGLSLDK